MAAPNRRALERALVGYEIGGEIGRGGFGVVLRARHQRLGRDVAVKQLPPHLLEDRSVRDRFVLEARALASFDHPHIVPVYDFIEKGSVCLLVMELLPGGTVWDRFVERGLGPETACTLVLATCAALQYAHERGVLHRDTKPENLVFATDGRVKVTDFGIAKVIGGPDVLATRAGAVLGTPAYMAPEQALGVEVGPQCDVYGAGVMLYELLSGTLPFAHGGGPLAVAYRHVYDAPRPLSEAAPQVPPALAAVAMRSIARATEDRYATAVEFGCAIADGAATSWGRGWADRSEVSLQAAGPILDALDRAPLKARLRTPRPGEATPGARPSARRPESVRPSVATRVVDGGTREVRGADLVALRELVVEPRSPRFSVAVTAVLAAMLLAVAWSGIGGARFDEADQVRRGLLFVDGTDITRTPTLTPGATAEFTAFPEQGELLPDRVAIEYRLFGAMATSSETLLRTRFDLDAEGNVTATRPAWSPRPGGGYRATSQVGREDLAAYLHGTVTADVTLMYGEDPTRIETASLPVRIQGRGLGSLPAIGSAGLIALVMAVAYSLSRPLLRQADNPIFASLCLFFLGLVFGPAIVVLSWFAGAPEPQIATGLAAAGLGAALGVAAPVALSRLGRRRAYRRVAARAAQPTPALLKPV